MNEAQYTAEALALLGKGNTAKDWKETFYPQTAKQVALTTGVTVEQLIQHSYTKWLGLLPAVLERCGMNAEETRDLYDKRRELYINISINSSSCSLCRAYFRRDTIGKCTICPVYRERKRVKCDEFGPFEETTPWSQWEKDKNPVPMLESLVKAMEFAKNNPELYQGRQYQPGDDAV